MEKWVLSVVGIVALSVLLDIIIPDGEMSKYIKGIFAVMTVSVIFAPVPNFIANIIDGKFDFSILDNSSSIVIDETFVDEFNSNRINVYEDKISDFLRSNGVNINNVEIECDEEKTKLKKIIIELEDNNQEAFACQLIGRIIDIKDVEVMIIGSG